MRHQLRLVLVLLFAVALVTPVLAQETKAVKAVAGMLLTLNHFPNDAQKKELQALADAKTTTPQEKVIVTAVMNLVHSVSAADKPKVEALMKDPAATASVKTLAGILDKFLHMATDADKVALKKMAS